MKCPHCGVMLPADARFCAGCGQALPGARGPAPGAPASKTLVIVLVAGAGALLFVMFAGLIAAIAIPNFLNAVDRSKQKRSMADMRAIGTALGSYAAEHREYPVAKTAGELGSQLAPAYIQSFPMLDGWGKPFQISSDGEGYEILSFGKDGVAQGCDGGATADFTADICFTDGQFTQWPEGLQH